MTQTLAILMSGRGSNMAAIADACANAVLDARVTLVISNRPNTAGLSAARQRALQTAVVDHTLFDDRQSFDRALHKTLSAVQPDWIVLAGFMRILTAEFVDLWHGRIINIHPSLLPKYPGLNTHARALAAGDSKAGASVHIVTSELDAGPVIAQVHVPIHPGDTTESLAQRVLDQEHALYIKALQLCIKGLDKPAC